MNKLFKNLIISALFVCALIFIYCSFFVPFSQDEGVFLTIAKGLLNGLLPYRDFFDHKTPGIYFALIIPAKFLGTALINYRSLALLINIVTSLFVFKIANKYKRGVGALAAVSYIFLVYIFEGYFLIAEPFLALFLSASFYLILRNDNKYNYLLAGVSACLAILFKQPALLSVLPLSIFVFINRKNIDYYILGLTLPMFFMLLWVFSNNLFSFFVSDVFSSNLYYPSEDIAKTFYSAGNLIYKSWYFWFLLFYFIWRVKVKNKSILIALLFLPAISFMFRSYPHYWIQSLPFLAIAFSIAIDNFSLKYKKWSIIILILFLLTSISTMKWFLWMHSNVWKFQATEQAESTKYIKSLDAQYLFAENRYVSYYFLTNKSSISKYLYITEITDHYRASSELIERLDGDGRLIVLWPNDGKVYSEGIENKVKNNFKKIKTYDKLNMDIYVNY